MKNRMKDCARHSVCLLAFLTWLAGCGLIGSLLWILLTSSNLRHFFKGTQVFSYVLLSLGGILFTYGLIGCIGTFKRGNCLIKFFLLFSVLAVSAEIGGIVALNFLKIKMGDVFESAWTEVNQNSRNLVQQQLSCCGLLGPEEFTANTEPMDDSCYSFSPEESITNATVTAQVRKLHRVGCKQKLEEWFLENQLIWIAALVIFIFYQVIGILLSVYVISKNKSSRSSSMSSLDNARSHTYL